MKNQKIRKLKRILTGFGVGIAGTSAVIPVIACGENETTTSTGGAIEDAIDQVKKELALDNVELDNGIVSNLPDAPDGTHWEYRVGDDGNFSPTPPVQINPDENVVIRLVSDSNTVQLPENVEAEVTVNDDLDDDSDGQVIEITEDTKTELDKVVINSNGTVENPVNVPNTHFEYSTDGGLSFASQVPENLDAGQAVVVKLVANTNYELSTNDELLTQTTVLVNKEVTVSDALASELKSAYLSYSENRVDVYVPSAPEHTHWEYALQSDNYSENFSLDNLQPGDVIKIRLAADGDYHLSQQLERTNIEVPQPWSINVEALNKAFEEVRVDTFGNYYNIPNAPDKTAWTFAVNDAVNYQNITNIFNASLSQGDKVKFKLASHGDIILTGDELAEHVITVTKTISVGNLVQELKNVPSKLSADVDILPTAAENTHWEYELADGTITTSLSDDLATGEKIAVRLVADENYYFNQSVERDDFVFAHFVRTSDALRSAFDQVTIRANDEEIVGLPAAPKNSHWEYQITKGNLKSPVYYEFSPAKYFQSDDLVPGSELKIRLVVNNNSYELDSDPIERSITVDKAIVDIKSPMENGLSMKEQLQQDLDKFFNFDPANESINWVPDYIPEGTYWEYSIDGGEFTLESPQIGPEYYSGEKALNLKLRLTTNNGYDDSTYELNSDFEWSIEAAGIVDTTNYEEWIEAATDGASLPESPEHAGIMHNSEPWAVTDPNRPYHAYAYWIEADEGWILSRDVMVGKDFI